MTKIGINTPALTIRLGLAKWELVTTLTANAMPTTTYQTELIKAEQFLPPHQIPTPVFNVCKTETSFVGQVVQNGQKVTVYPNDWIQPDASQPQRCWAFIVK